ncbi:MAG: (E)-4-hydroxy-3-methylbut-2-enyl-diphosphate synthase [Bacteroidetes bacterium]|nr:(E)-4-hydroxy-3-methylbut-2-enyl-diphosphate synthase [Bacteroidota bacterium]HET6243316.1 (E)-4-hydroxy-3-methylbut-2-enyl-diphosphate synthase [Bacteroidia bacterium]
MKTIPSNQYCNDLNAYSRFKTRVVKVGNLAIGGDNPIRIQSMTTTDTMDTFATVEQSIRMIEAGCELVRITAPSMNEARNLENIKKELIKRGYNTPLVADIHFTPNAAELAARIVEKVRVNPGNYVDKKKFQVIEYTNSAYNAELERIRQRFVPLVKICKEYGTAMRIGTNHGSLSDRILNRYGDTPLGMVESALEFLRICEDHNYYDIVLSMKASNTQVMVQAYRLLVNKMMEFGMNYPLHLGVTEAGEGEDGRIKSAVGIGALLEDGIGDTVRVSLTEEPEFEIPIAKALIERYIKPRSGSIKELVVHKKALEIHNPFEYRKRKTREILNIGGSNVPRVIADFSHKEKITAASLFAVGYNYSVALDKWNIADSACDFIYAGENKIDFETPGTLGIIYNAGTWKKSFANKPGAYPVFSWNDYFSSERHSTVLNFILIDVHTISSEFLNQIKNDNTAVLIADTFSKHGMAEQRAFFFLLNELENSQPVIIRRNYKQLTEENLQLYSGTDIGSLFIDGFGDGIWIQTIDCGSLKNVNNTAFNILQATRTRISKTEYISCPSCGRTLFDLQETTARIRQVTDHLKGIKIGIMGCIVNGPGEMADADYGYVGTGVGKITLYKGREVVKKNIASVEAVDALVDLIKIHGDWVEKPV